MKKLVNSDNLNEWQRSILESPLLYRLKMFDFVLPGLFFSAFFIFLFRTSISIGDNYKQILFILSFVIIVLIINRMAYLFSGRGKINIDRLKNVQKMLLKNGKIKLIDFCLKADIPFTVFCHALDQMMAENYLLGYLQRDKLEVVINDNPIDDKKCPVCKGVLSDSMLIDKACGLCNTNFYI